MPTPAEIQAEIDEINAALSHIRKGGQAYTITTASGGGTSRNVTMADYDTLVAHKKSLQMQLDSINKVRSVRVRPGW